MASGCTGREAETSRQVNINCITFFVERQGSASAFAPIAKLIEAGLAMDGEHKYSLIRGIVDRDQGISTAALE
jgi:hypothetical protein